MKKVYTILLSVFLAVSAFAQDEATENFRSSFVEGNYLMEEFNFSVALDVWKNALNEDPENSNVNYKVGVCFG